jgi:hypothetical protein
MMPHIFLKRLTGSSMVLATLIPLVLAGCKGKEQGDGAPPPSQVIQVPDMNLLTIDNNDVPKFPVVTAEKVERGRHQDTARRQREEGATAFSGAEP